MRFLRLFDSYLSSFVSKLIAICFSPILKKGVKAYTEVPPSKRIPITREKLEAISDEDLREMLRAFEGNSLRDKRYTSILKEFGILDEVKELIVDELFLREHRRKHQNMTSNHSQ